MQRSKLWKHAARKARKLPSESPSWRGFLLNPLILLGFIGSNQKLLTLLPQAQTFLQQIESHDQIAMAAYHDVCMKQWHGDRIAILGDAAHALSPQLGQGVNLALMDAAALADALTEERSLTDALASYSNRRRRHLAFYQSATRWTTPFFQSDLLPLGWLRDAVFPIINAIPPLRRQMTATMAGGKTGPFSSLPAANQVV